MGCVTGETTWDVPGVLHLALQTLTFSAWLMQYDLGFRV